MLGIFAKNTRRKWLVLELGIFFQKLFQKPVQDQNVQVPNDLGDNVHGPFWQGYDQRTKLKLRMRLKNNMNILEITFIFLIALYFNAKIDSKVDPVSKDFGDTLVYVSLRRIDTANNRTFQGYKIFRSRY